MFIRNRFNKFRGPWDNFRNRGGFRSFYGRTKIRYRNFKGKIRGKALAVGSGYGFQKLIKNKNVLILLGGVSVAVWFALTYKFITLSPQQLSTINTSLVSIEGGKVSVYDYVRILLNLVKK